MRKTFLIISILLLSITSVFGVTPEQTIVQSDVSNIQSTPSYTAPSGYQAKGFVGSILENIFWPGSYLIKNAFITAFQTIEGTFTNNVPRWDGAKFVEGTIYDVSGNVGIGTQTPVGKLHINTTSDASLSSVNHALTIGDTSASNIVLDNNEILARSNGSGAPIYIQNEGTSGDTILNRAGGNVGIGTSSPSYKLDVIGDINASGNYYGDGKQIVRFNDSWLRLNQQQDFASGIYTPGALRVDGEIVSNGGMSGLDLSAGISGNNFNIEGVNGILINDPGEGLNFHGDASIYVRDDAIDDKLIIEAGKVGIGTDNPTEKLDVRGKIHMWIGTQSTDSDNIVATKGYVDNNSSGCNWSGWKCSCHAATTNSTESISVVGLQCESGVMKDIKMLFSDASTGNLSCPSSWQGCDLYEYNHNCKINPSTGLCF